MNKLLICVALSATLAACGENMAPSTEVSPPQETHGERRTVREASATAIPSTPMTFADSINETGWFRLNDRETMAVAKPFTRCAIERINGTKAVRGQLINLSSGEDLSVSGWVSDPSRRTPRRFLLVLRSPQGTYATNATAGRERADVASALKSELLADSGYLSVKPLSGVAPGEYSVSLLQLASDDYVTCGSAARVTVQ